MRNISGFGKVLMGCAVGEEVARDQVRDVVGTSVMRPETIKCIAVKGLPALLQGAI